MVNISVTTALAASLLVATSTPASMVAVQGDPVVTRGGKVSGTVLPSGVRAYLGIPFAQAPVGVLRWVPPQPMQWNGTWNADRTGPECVQILRPHTVNHYFGEEPVSEDCLYLNIWLPAKAAASGKLPVIVFIYGGGGTVGSSGMAVYSGAKVAEHGAIFVSFNYRLGILGFLAHPELTQEQSGHSGNYGYLDQNAALRWIRDNIAAFGGDASKVVITGQSFGATSVAAQLFSPLSKGLFRGAAMWSACSFTSSAVPLSEAEAVGKDIQIRLHASDLKDMRNIPADKILALLQEEHQLGANVQGVRLPPTIDGLFWTHTKAAVLESRQLNDVPIIVGSNGDDLDSNRSPLKHAKSVDDFRATANKLYGAEATEFLKLFPVRSDADVLPAARESAMEAGFLAQSQSCAELQSKFNHSPAYVEVFTRKHSYEPGVAIADQNTDTIGAYHTADVPFWFGTQDAFNWIRPTRRWTTEDRSLSAIMMDSLVAFAETGTPSTPALSWPAWSSKGQRYVVFDQPVVIKPMNAKRMKWLDSHPAASGGDP
jgi:para-nitrobenzyl esterase